MSVRRAAIDGLTSVVREQTLLRGVDGRFEGAER
jgi:hypothetical protein